MINRVAVRRDPDQDGDATSGSGCLDLCPDVGKPIVSVLHLRALVEQRIRFIEKQDRTAAFSFLRGDGLNIRLTVSVGVATLPDVAASADGLIQAADEAMYWVKDHGKNGIHIAGS